MILGNEPKLVKEVISTLKPATLDQHPSGWLAKNALSPEWGKAESRASAAAMAYELQEGILQPLINATENEGRHPGFCSWLLPFIVCLLFYGNKLRE